MSEKTSQRPALRYIALIRSEPRNQGVGTPPTLENTQGILKALGNKVNNVIDPPEGAAHPPPGTVKPCRVPPEGGGLPMELTITYRGDRIRGTEFTGVASAYGDETTQRQLHH